MKTHATDNAQQARFEHVADLTTAPTCEVRRADSTECGRPAEWWWAFHDCSRGLACSECISAWHRSVADAFVKAAQPCNWCGQVFSEATDSYTLVAL